MDSEALADDIIGVEFADTLNGKVTTSVQETWITADAGQTWQKQSTRLALACGPAVQRIGPG